MAKAEQQPRHDWLEGLSRAYALFGDLLLYGVTSGGAPIKAQQEPTQPDLLTFVRAIPELADALRSEDGNTTFNADRWAASHYALFGRSLQPLAGIFLDPPSNAAITSTTLQLEHFYARIRGEGYHLQTQGHNERADHLGLLLHALSFLTGAEADAVRDALPQAEVLTPVQAHQKWLLENFLLPCLSILEATLRSLPTRHGQSFFALVVALAHESCALQASHLQNVSVSIAPPAPAPHLQAETTSTADIATYLLTPIQSGWFLTQAHITAFGRAFDLPHGFGDRQLVFKNLFNEAARFDALPAFAHALHEHADTLLTGLPPHDPWRSRLTQTKMFLTELSKYSECTLKIKLNAEQSH